MVSEALSEHLIKRPELKSLCVVTVIIDGAEGPSISHIGKPGSHEYVVPTVLAFPQFLTHYCLYEFSLLYVQLLYLFWVYLIWTISILTFFYLTILSRLWALNMYRDSIFWYTELELWANMIHIQENVMYG